MKSNADVQRKILDRRSNAISYKAVFNPSFPTADGGRKRVRCVAYFVFFFTTPDATQNSSIKAGIRLRYA